MARTPNGALTHRAAMRELGQLAQDTRDELLAFGLIEVGDETPAIATLESIRRLGPGNEGKRTRMLHMLLEYTFQVCTSRPVRIKWKRRYHDFGPQPKVVAMPIALQLIEHVRQINDRVLGYERQPFYTGKGDSGEPVMIHWSHFLIGTEDGGVVEAHKVQGATEAHIIAGATYKRLLERHMHHRTAAVQSSQQAADVSEVFAPNNPHARTKATNLPTLNNSFAMQVKEGVSYPEMTGSVTSDYDPRQPLNVRPGEIDAALKGEPAQPTPAPVLPKSGGQEQTQLPPPPPSNQLPPPPPAPPGN